MTDITLHAGDNRETLRRLIDQGVQVHSVVTDPPYGLTSIIKRFGKGNAAPALSNGATGVFKRASGGFMGQQWDGSGIERDPEFWKLIYDILLPGGYVIAFSGSRTGHWQACAMEMAGFTMHPMTGWVFGQGFPKDHDAAKAIDRELGVERKVVGTEWIPNHIRSGGYVDAAHGTQRAGFARDVTQTTSQEAHQWEGWAYGTQSIKPALEPIYIGQKPFSEKNGAQNLLKHGVGAVNIDACRVPAPGEEITNHSRGADSAISKGIYGDSSAQATHQTAGQVSGRHPANLLLDGSEAVAKLFPQTASGTGAVKRKSAAENQGNTGSTFGAESRPEGTEVTCYGDSGSAARYFNTFPPDNEAIYYHAKATAKDRIVECTICGTYGIGEKPKCGCQDATTGKTSTRSHPTVKPTGLMEWLVRLVTPTGGIVLDPFGGTGSTGAAARAQGFDCILMEADENYCRDIRTRFNLTNPDEDFEGAFDDPLLPAAAAADNYDSLFV